MSKRGLAALYQSLSSSDSLHLGDEMLARIADAAMAGEDIETRFAAQLVHLESCEYCASQYSELVEMLEAAIEEMAEAAEAVSLPETPPVEKATHWRQALTTKIEEIGQSIRLTFAPSPAAQLKETPGTYGPKEEWLLGQINLLTPIQAEFTAVLSRQTPETCRLTITLRNKAGPPPKVNLAINYFQKTNYFVMPPAGMVQIDDIPITAVPTLTITITPTNY